MIYKNDVHVVTRIFQTPHSLKLLKRHDIYNIFIYIILYLYRYHFSRLYLFIIIIIIYGCPYMHIILLPQGDTESEQRVCTSMHRKH